MMSYWLSAASLPVMSVALVLATGPEARAQSAAAAAVTDASTKGAPQLQEVVVTAQRRETSLQRTPEAVSVLSGAVQRDRGQQGLADLSTTVPNVSFNNTSNTSQLYIRGIGNTFITAGGDPGVALYQDGAYVSDMNTSNAGEFDVDHIEVLRGPQGALYGRNAVGGAINIISAKPSDTFHLGVDAVFGDYGRADSEGYVTGPLGFAATDFRISYQIRDLDGYAKNALAGQPGAPSALDDLHSQAVRVQTLTDLPTGGKFNFLASYYNEDENGAALSVEPYSGFIYPTQAIFGLIPSSNPRLVYANVGKTTERVTTVGLTYVQPIGRETLTAQGNYRDSQQYYINDCDGTSANSCVYPRRNSAQDWYGDIHLASPGDTRLRWLVGATAQRFNLNQSNAVVFDTLVSYLNPAVPTNVPLSFPTATGGKVDTTSYAAYVDLHYRLNDIFSVTGQARYSSDIKKAVEFAQFPVFGVAISNFHNSQHTVSTPFKVGAEAQLTPSVLFYVDYATARKDGAINVGTATPPVKPEDVRTEEVGAKTEFLDHRIRINAALFNSEYDNLQISQLIGVTVGLANAPKANIKGAELEIVAVPTRGLQLSFNGGYLDSKFVEFSNTPTTPGLNPGTLLNLKGNYLPYDSPWSLNFDVTYSANPIAGLVPMIDAQYSYHARTYFNEFNATNDSQGPVGLVNVTASISPEVGHWKIYGFVHNLTDATIATGATVYAGLLGAERAVSYAPPRNFGIGASYRF